MPFPLPPELTISILELLDPFASFNFALTCKAHWNLCNPIIKKHERLFAENRVLDARDSRYPYENHVLWDKLKEILSNPVVGEYVREINLPSSRAIYLDGNAAHDFQLTPQSARLNQEDIKRYVVFAEELDDLYRSSDLDLDLMFADFDNYLSKGSSEPIIVMLVHCLPYLKTFRFTDLEMSEIVFRCVGATAVAYGDPELAPKLPFQHLTTVAMAYWDTEMCSSFEWCQVFCAIPSLRNFVANAMGGDEMESGYDHGELPTSKVKELVLRSSRFSTNAIESIVSNMPSLERFSYELGDATVNEGVMPMPRQDLATLVKHLSHSLEHLCFEVGDTGDDFEDDIGEVSLRDFEKLKTLRIDWHLLWPGLAIPFDDEEKSDGGFYQEGFESKTDFDLRSLLPKSLEKLCLTGSFTEEEKEQVEKIREAPSDFTPLLEKIYIQDYSMRLENEDVPGIHANPLLKLLEGHGN